MTKLYEEFGLDRDLSIEEINAELTRQETAWTERKFTDPEHAIRRLELIAQAKKVFGTDETKRKYDTELDNGQIISGYSQEKQQCYQELEQAVFLQRQAVEFS